MFLTAAVSRLMAEVVSEILANTRHWKIVVLAMTFLRLSRRNIHYQGVHRWYSKGNSNRNNADLLYLDKRDTFKPHIVLR